MSFPAPNGFRLVLASLDEEGHGQFEERRGSSATLDIPGVVSGGGYWRVDGGHTLDNIGGAPEVINVAGVNGSTFSVMSFPAHSAGKLDIAGMATLRDEHFEDPAMHATDTIDYEIILSGKIDIELPGGKVRTLVPGDLLVMAGAAHAWKNHYDEDCQYVAITIGFNE